MKNLFEKNVDVFMDLTKNEKIYNDSQININKGSSQCRQILECIKYIENEKILVPYPGLNLDCPTL